LSVTLDSGVTLESWTFRTSAGHRVAGYLTPASGKPVLHFIHGNGYCGLVYEPLLSRLSLHYDLFISDIQGHGDSERNGAFLGWNRTAELCTEVWEHFRPRWAGVPVFGGGHSFGGVMTALMMAQRPDLFSRSILLDPVLFSPNMVRVMMLSDVVGLWRLNSMASRTRKRRDHWPDRQSAHDFFAGRGMFRGWEDQALWAYVNHAMREDRDGGVRLKCRPSLEAEIFSTFPKRLWRSLKRVSTPTHVVYGDKSYDFVRESVPRWAAMNQAISTETLPGGHCFMQQDPDGAAEAVRASLERTG